MERPINKIHYTLFISDLHLQYSHKDSTQAFIHLLLQESTQADALYILGDLFDTWIGDDDITAFHQKIILALQQARRQGLPIYLLTGNRDFLLGADFAKAAGLQLISEPYLFMLYEKPTLLMHGDSLCTFDHLHQYWRTCTRHPFIQRAALRIPLPWRRRLAQWLRQRSQSHQQAVADYKLDVNLQAVNKTLQQSPAQLLIHGHTHRPGIHRDTSFTRIVLGAWHHHASILRYHEDGQFILQEVPFN